jgi:hypothetical protein
LIENQSVNSVWISGEDAPVAAFLPEVWHFSAPFRHKVGNMCAYLGENPSPPSFSSAVLTHFSGTANISLRRCARKNPGKYFNRRRGTLKNFPGLSEDLMK